MAAKPKTPAELVFLSSLEQGEIITQMRLSKRINVSIGLINALLKRAVHKGYVKARSAPYKRYAYYLTPRGFAEKGRLVAAYLETSLAFFRAAREEYDEVFARARRAGMKRFALAGGGELAEIALLAAREAQADIVAVLDRSSNGDEFHGIPIVRTVEELGGVDALVITESRKPQLAFDLLKETVCDAKILAPELLRITRTPLDFRPKVTSS